MRAVRQGLAAVTFMLLTVVFPSPVEGQTDIPRVEKVAFTDGSNSYKLNDIIEVTVTFSEVVAVTGTPQIDLTIGSLTRPADYQSGPPSTDLVFRYTVTDTDEAPETTIDANALKLNGGSIKKNNADLDADLAHEAHQDQYYKAVDGITPVFQMAAVHGAHLVLTYNDTLWLYARTPASDYTVTVNNVVRAVSAVAISARFVTLTLAAAVTTTDQVTVSYTVGTRPIRDKAGNIVAALVDQAVTTSAPYVSSLAISSTPAARQTYAGGEEIEVTVTFSESVTVTGAPQLFLTFDSAGVYEQAAPYVSGSGTAVLVFRYTVAEGIDRLTAGLLRLLGRNALVAGDEAPDGLSINADALHLNDGTIRDSDNQDALLILDGLTDVEEHKVDGVQPYWDVDNDDWLAVNGVTLTVRYDEMLDEDSVPAVDAFAVTVGGAPGEVTDVSIDDRTVTLTLRTPVGAGDEVRLSYTAPDGTAATPIRDLVGNTAQDFTDLLVRNDTRRVAVSFGAGQYTATEGGAAATVTVMLDKDPERTVEISLTTTNRDGATDDDYTEIPSSVIFTSGSPTVQTFTVTATDDAIDDGGESVQLGFGSPLPVGVDVGSPATTVVTIAELTLPPPPPPPPPRRPGPSGGSGDASACGVDLHGNTAARATSLALSVPTDGAICPAADTDYFTVTVPGRGLVFVDTAGGVNLRGTLLQNAVVLASGSMDRQPAARLGALVQPGAVVVAVQGQAGTTGPYDVVVTFVPGALENPSQDSFQSGLGLLSGWVCAADEVSIVIDELPAQVAAYGTLRADTAGACGDTNNGFGLLFNWNLLGDGAHTLRAVADGVEFGQATFTVTTLGEEFVEDVTGETVVEDFPSTGERVRLVWQEANQNFVLAPLDREPPPSSPPPSPAGGPTGALENPGPASFQSGLGLLSGWVCEADSVELEINGGPRLTAAYGTERADTAVPCGDTDNGFGLLFNWNLLGDEVHTVRALADGEEFGQATFTVTTLGVEFLQDGVGETVVVDFPSAGETVRLVWQESSQNFVIMPGE